MSENAYVRTLILIKQEQIGLLVVINGHYLLYAISKKAHVSSGSFGFWDLADGCLRTG